MSWYLKVLKKYAEFNGRARRKEFWMFVLFNAVFTALAAVFDNVFNTKTTGYSYGVFETLYLIGVFIPSLAVTVRRLHDIGKSGWMILIVLIPIIGVIWMLVLIPQWQTRKTNINIKLVPDIETKPASDTS